MKKRDNEKIIGNIGTFSGFASLLGSWQICHNVCLAIVAVLAVVGISLNFMPLEFLTRFAVPIWTVAFLLLIATFGLYSQKKCISKNQLLFNSGLIVASVPFESMQGSIKILWVSGSALILLSIYGYAKKRFGVGVK